MSGLRILHVAAVGLSAGLLFLVQPMIGKMLLPRLGGSPLVWNTCMLFFQSALLAGYAYAHLLASRVRAGRQIAAHLPAIALPLLVLPMSVGDRAFAGEGWPVPWLLGTLAIAVGLPFFALSTTGPLLQRWYSWSGERDARNPYFLYAVSNAGSLAALLAYPLFVEPSLPLAGSWRSQTGLWTIGYAVFAAVTLACGWTLRGRPEPRAAVSSAAPVELGRRLRWLALAFVPSAAMLGATQYLTTDLAAIPLLWVLPLSVYLLTFILSFLDRRPISGRAASAALAVLAVAVVAGFGLRAHLPPTVLIALHLATLFAAGLVCHGRLADDRPPPEGLTGYYLIVGAGGALGGVFAAIVAPLLFDSLFDYPIALLLACLVRDPLGAEPGDPERSSWLDIGIPAAIGVVAVGLALAFGPPVPGGTTAIAALPIAVPAILVLTTLARPTRFGLGLIVLLIASWAPVDARGDVIFQQRTFFGIHRVIRFDPAAGAPGGQLPKVHNLYHGTTKHGMQIVHDQLRRVPTLYFHPEGPIGVVFMKAQSDPDLEVAVVGLGCGSLAAYGKPGQHYTFYEIDPEVVRLARDSGYFTYMNDSRATIDVVLGDGRRSLAREPDGRFDIIVLDAFSSDALPVHLITREAIEIYARKLEPDGLLAFNLTNSYVDLEPVVDAIAATLGLRGRIWRDGARLTGRQVLTGKVPSIWAVLSRDEARLAALGWPAEATPLPREPGRAPDRRFVWTDDYSNLLATLRARGQVPLP